MKHAQGRRKRREGAKAVGIWLRVSTEEQAEGESPEHHEVRAQMYAQAKGWEVVRVYDLSAVSGKTVIEHPEAVRMLDDVRSGRIEGLIFSKLARLARNTRELLEIADYFQEHEADLISLEESIDTSTPAGRFFYSLIAAMSQWEREEIASRVKASVKVRAALGKSLGGAAPYGYRWDDGSLVLDDDEAPIRKRMFELFQEHRRIKTVARLLNEAGHRTRKGANFSGATVRRLLQDPIAMGRRRANYTRSTGEGKHWEMKPEDEWEWSEVPAIVSGETWQEVNSYLAERKRGRKPAKRRVHLFSGFAFCGACDHKMYVPSGYKKYVCTSCRRKIPIDTLELIFAEQLKGFVLSPQSVAAHLESADTAIADKHDLLASLSRDQERITREMDKVYRLYLDEEISPAGFGERYQPLERRRDELDLEIPRLQGEVDFLRTKLLSKEEILRKTQDFYENWKKFDIEEKRALVEHIVERIDIGESDVSISLISPAPLPPVPPNGSPSALQRTGATYPNPKGVAKKVRNLMDSSPPAEKTGRGSRTEPVS